MSPGNTLNQTTPTPALAPTPTPTQAFIPCQVADSGSGPSIDLFWHLFPFLVNPFISPILGEWVKRAAENCPWKLLPSKRDEETAKQITEIHTYLGLDEDNPEDAKNQLIKNLEKELVRRDAVIAYLEKELANALAITHNFMGNPAAIKLANSVVEDWIDSLPRK